MKQQLLMESIQRDSISSMKMTTERQVTPFVGATIETIKTFVNNQLPNSPAL
jgi:hypothetical protein